MAQEAADAPSATVSLAPVQVEELRAALKATRAAMEGQAAELASARQALAERDAASAEQKAVMDAAESENSGLRAQLAAAADSAAREAETLRRTVEEQAASLLSARQALAERDAAATAANLDAAVAAAVVAGDTAAEAALKVADQVKQAAESAAFATMEELAALRIELGQWEAELAAVQRKEDSGAGEVQSSMTLHPASEYINGMGNRIETGIKRQDTAYVEETFKHFAKEGKTLPKDQFIPLLEELGMLISADDVDGLFKSLDVNGDRGLDWDQFKTVVMVPSIVEQLIKTLPISQLIADALPIEEGRDPLRVLSETSSEQIKCSCSVLMQYLETMLEDAVRKLKESVDCMDRMQTGTGAKKFEVPVAMSAGMVKDFFGGLAERLGV